MSPNFLAKLVKSTPSHREDSRRGRTPSPVSRSVTYTPLPSIVINNNHSVSNQGSTRSNTPDSTSQPSVTVIPPSPHGSSEDVDKAQPPGYESDRRVSKLSQSVVADRSGGSGHERRTMSFPSSTSPAVPPVPPLPDEIRKTPTTPRPPHLNQSLTNSSKHSLALASARTLSSSSSTGNLREAAQNQVTSSPPASALELPSAIRHNSSNKPLKSAAQPQVSHTRSVTYPVTDRQSAEEGTPDSPSKIPLVDSPTSLNFGDSAQPNSPPTTVQTPRSAESDITSAGLNGGTTAPPNTPAVSYSTTSLNTNAASLHAPVAPKKKRSWRRGSTPSRKPTGLAGALAASGMAMANVSTAVPQLTLPNMQNAINGLQKTQQQQQQLRKSAPGSPRSGTNTSLPTPSTTRTERTRSSSSNKSRPRRPSTTVSVHSENNSIYGDDRSYSGLDEYSSDGDSASSDDLMDLDLGEDNIPVTGFAVASNKRNADFHELFSNIPEGDYLIEDYGCALQREILIQGRIYISENHLCFHSNIFGWVTDLSVPISEVTALEKKMTAFVIPNAIQITTRQSKYTFASFLSRDTTFDIIFNIWRLAKPEYSAGYTSAPGSGRGSLDSGRPGMDEVREIDVGKSDIPLRKVTQCACSRDGTHFTDTALETILPGTPDRIYNLMFASGFIKDFMKDNQKLLDIQISDWSPLSGDLKLLTRNMSYIKPLSASIGPKQTKCEIRDETIYCDFDDYVVTVTTTRTPDVPSGGVFAVKTRTCIMWASAVSSKVVVTSQVDWTGRSFIKGIIERSAIEGQKSYHSDLDAAMRLYIQQHQSEFVPQGIDPASLAPTRADIAELGPSVKPGEGQLDDERKKREKERNQRGLQWALDTFEGASQVAKQSAAGAIELIKETWEQSTSTSICIFIIIGLVFSNLWTLMRVGSGKEDVGRRKEFRQTESREKWIQSVVTTLLDEMAAGKGFPMPDGGSSSSPPPVESPSTPKPNDWREEVTSIQKTLEGVEERVRLIKESLNALD